MQGKKRAQYETKPKLGAGGSPLKTSAIHPLKSSSTTTIHLESAQLLEDIFAAHKGLAARPSIRLFQVQDQGLMRPHHRSN